MNRVFKITGMTNALPSTSSPIYRLWDEGIRNGFLYHGTRIKDPTLVKERGLKIEYKPYEDNDIEILNNIWRRIFHDDIPFVRKDSKYIFLTASKTQAATYANTGSERVFQIIARSEELLNEKGEQLIGGERKTLEELHRRYKQIQVEGSPYIITTKLHPCIESAIDIYHPGLMQRISTSGVSIDEAKNNMLLFLADYKCFEAKTRELAVTLETNIEKAAERIIKAIPTQLNNLSVPFVNQNNIVEVTILI